MSQPGAAVRTEALTKTYGTGETLVRALDAVTVEIHRGEFTAVMGPSGSGKSTLMHLTAGLDAATSGRSWIGDVEITALDDKALTLLRRDRVGFIFQAFNLLPTMDARANILLPLKLAHRKPDQDWFNHVVDVLGIGDRLTHRPSELSGGQQQRVAAARALITRPDVVFADEPTGALDSAASEQLLTFLRASVSDLGQTIVMVRAAATTGALLVGVTLVTMMTVGAATGQASIEADLARHYPMDVEVTSWELLSDAQVELAATLPDVAASTVLLSSSATTEDGQWVPLRGMEPDSAGVLRAPIDLGQLTDGVLLVGPEMKLPDGVPITLTGAERQVTLTVAVNPRADGLNAVTPANMAQLDPHPMRSLGVRLVDGVDPVGAVARVGAALGEVGPGVDVNSVAERRVQVQQMIDTVLLVVLGLLAVAVVIAVVGIGNTLALSVHERRQESGLLRAMGLTRGQLRASLGWEAVLLAAVAVVLGLVLGIVYGFAGVSALVSADAELLLRVPWERLALIVVVALLAGWLASVLPSIRAAKVPPAAALALGE